MIYQQFQDIQLSSLGMGAMRLPTLKDDPATIDEVQVAEMVEYALKNGINYFDTAWGYHDGNSELVMGKVLSQYPRESYYLASKFPGYDLTNMGKIEEIFEKQLEKCRVEYFDFYLFHNVNEVNIDAYLNPEYKIAEYMIEQKKKGRIRHIGFSVHGTYETMMRFLEAYGDIVEFCQIQLNWLDYGFQHADLKVAELNKRKIPIWVMEPLRGGKLATLADEYVQKLKDLRPDEAIPAWSFRYLQSLPGVTMILSGMSNFEQLKENMLTFETSAPLNKAEMQALKEIGDDMLAKGTLPCTACRYCTVHCPQELDIPQLIEIYNEHIFSGGGFIAPMRVSTIPAEKRPNACIGCRSCESLCPQNIKISEAMADFAAKIAK